MPRSILFTRVITNVLTILLLLLITMWIQTENRQHQLRPNRRGSQQASTWRTPGSDPSRGDQPTRSSSRLTDRCNCSLRNEGGNFSRCRALADSRNCTCSPSSSLYRVRRSNHRTYGSLWRPRRSVHPLCCISPPYRWIVLACPIAWPICRKSVDNVPTMASCRSLCSLVPVIPIQYVCMCCVDNVKTRSDASIFVLFKIFDE